MLLECSDGDGATNRKTSLDQGLECTFACIKYRVGERKMYLKEIWEKKMWTFYRLGGWQATFNVDFANGQCGFAGTQSSSLSWLFRVRWYYCKADFSQLIH